MEQKGDLPCYSDHDLNKAIRAGIFTAEQVSKFRSMQQNNLRGAIEETESFRLISGFNDIFVAISCLVLLISLGSVISFLCGPVLDSFITATLSWLLAEVFILKRRLAFTSIVLLISFVFTCSSIGMVFLQELGGTQGFLAYTCLCAITAGVHWRRFHVPITVAVGIGAILLGALIHVGVHSAAFRQMLLPVLLLSGIVTFILAMYLDLSDRRRITRRSDTAFWLHLLAAPMIVHPLFLYTKLLFSDSEILQQCVLFSLYIALALVSLIIDRRAFILSALIYITITLSGLVSALGLTSLTRVQNTYVGLLLGVFLIIFAGFWQQLRQIVIPLLPDRLRHYLP